MSDSISGQIEAIYQAESRRVLATLIRLLGDFDRAEEALHDAVRAALEQWPRDGVPANPRAWLVSAGRFKAIDAMRRQKRFDPLESLGDPGDAPFDRPARMDRCREARRRRSAPSDLHLLSSRALERRADRADAAGGLRAHHRGDRAGLPHARADAGPADRAREGEDSHREDSVSGAWAGRSCPTGSMRCCG